MRKIGASVLMLMLLAGCLAHEEPAVTSPPPPPPPPAAPVPSPPALRGAVEPQAGEPEKDVTFMGIESSFASALGGHTNSYFIRSSVNKKTGAVEHQLYVQNYYNGAWRYWNGARDENADVLDFVSIKREVVPCGNGNCPRVEIFSAGLDDMLLHRKAEANASYRVMFSAKNGREMVIGLSPKQIRAQLAAIERLRTPPKATPAGPTDKSSEPKKISSGGR